MIITTVRIQSLSTDDQSQVPFTFGQVFKAGDLAPTDGLKAGDLPLQVDVKATHADGSVRHAVISGVLPKLKAGETVALQLEKAKSSNGIVLGMQDPDKVSIVVTIDGVVYKARPAKLGETMLWLEGPIACEVSSDEVLVDDSGNIHPLLTARLALRSYAGCKTERVEFIVENTKTFAAPAQAFTYDVELQLIGAAIYKKAGLRHYHHSRWHQYAWTGAAPAIHIQHDTAYLIASKAVSNYDRSILPNEGVLAAMGGALSGDNTGPMMLGTVTTNMAMAGGRGDIGPLPDWAVNYLLTMDRRAKDVMMANADASASLSIHYRDEGTGYPVRTDNDANSRISTHQNLAATGPLPVPRFATDADGGSPYNVDLGHFPSMVYLPYLLTGEYFYLEEMQFWAAFSPIGTDPGYNGYGKGLLRWHQVRGQAWTMRALGEVAAVTPDVHPLKGYFNAQLDNNLSFYAQTYVAGNPNNLGMYDGSGEGSAPINGCAPWQDDFFTWSFAYLAELGFDKAAPIAQWKAKFPVGRMTADGFCYILAAHYAFPFIRDTDGGIYKDFEALYKGNFDRDRIPTDGWELVTLPNGPNYNELPCGSRAQADYLGAINGYGWELGRMVGYSDSAIGYLSNMQPALALAVDAGVPNAKKAWLLFQARKAKPDYSKNPQWNIIPRTLDNPPPAVIPPPLAPTIKLNQVPAPSIAGTWKAAGKEGDTLKVAVGAFLRYGAVGIAYRYGQALMASVQASNAVFGGDPAPQVVKTVEVFVPDPPRVPAKIKTGSNTVLKKLKGLRVLVFDPQTMGLVRSVENLTASSTGVLTFSDASLTVGATYGLQVADASGKVLCFIWPVVATK